MPCRRQNSAILIASGLSGGARAWYARRCARDWGAGLAGSEMKRPTAAATTSGSGGRAGGRDIARLRGSEPIQIAHSAGGENKDEIGGSPRSKKLADYRKKLLGVVRHRDPLCG